MRPRSPTLSILLAALPVLLGASPGDPVDVDLRLAEVAPFEWRIAPPDLEVGELRLRASDFLPPAAEEHPGRMIGFGSAMFGIQIATLVLFPPANWSGRAAPRASQLTNSFTGPPVWNDGDVWTTNYVLHPLMGSLLYTAARRSNYGPVGAFLFATAGSTVWEYGIEGWFEQPSWPDLLVTSTTGALLGEARWWARQRLLSDGRPGFWGQLGLVFADPIAEAQLLFQKFAGRKAARDLFGDELL
jgi:hypothetical protein